MQVTAGVAYAIVVDGLNGGFGEYNISITTSSNEVLGPHLVYLVLNVQWDIMAVWPAVDMCLTWVLRHPNIALQLLSSTIIGNRSWQHQHSCHQDLLSLHLTAARSAPPASIGVLSWMPWSQAQVGWLGGHRDT